MTIIYSSIIAGGHWTMTPVNGVHYKFRGFRWYYKHIRVDRPSRGYVSGGRPLRGIWTQKRRLALAGHVFDEEHERQYIKYNWPAKRDIYNGQW